MTTPTLPQLALPYVLTTAGGPHLRVVLASPSKTLNVTLNGSYFNDGQTSHATNLLKALIDGLNAAEAGGTPSGGTWNNSSDSGQRVYLLQRDGGGGDSSTNLQFPSSELPATALGFTGTTTPTSDSGGVTKWQALRVAGRVWIPRPTDRAWCLAQSYTSEDTLVTTEGLDGAVGTRDLYGSRTRWEVRLTGVAAAAVWQKWQAESAFASAAGLVAGEAWGSLDAFRKAWARDLSPSAVCRYAPDYATPATWYSVQCGADDDWIGGLATSGAVQEEGLQPLEYSVTLTFNEVT